MLAKIKQTRFGGETNECSPYYNKGHGKVYCHFSPCVRISVGEEKFRCNTCFNVYLKKGSRFTVVEFDTKEELKYWAKECGSNFFLYPYEGEYRDFYNGLKRRYE